MSAITVGSGLGLSNTSANLLGNLNPLGDATLGRNGERIYANVVTGNLVIQRQRKRTYMDTPSKSRINGS
jgi:hypothetical protein